MSWYVKDTNIGDIIKIINPSKRYLKDGEIYVVVGHTKIMQYPYVMVNGEKRYVGEGEYIIME